MLIAGPIRPSRISRRSTSACWRGERASRTNTRLVVEAAWPKPVMFFPARFDHWLVQTGDGYAAHIAGAIGVSTDAQASWWGIDRARHRAARADRRVRRRYRRGDRGHGGSHRTGSAARSRWSISTTTAWHVAGGGARARDAAVRRAARYVGDDGRSLGAAADGGLRSARRQSAAGAQRPRRARRRGVPARPHHRRRAASIPRRSAASNASGCRWIPTASARRCSPGRFDFTGDIVMVEGSPLAKQGRPYRPNPRLERVD